jgi:hypothetical protein
VPLFVVMPGYTDRPELVHVERAGQRRCDQ